MNLFREAADIKTADQLNLPTPTAVYHTEVTQPTALQQQMVQELSERALERALNRRHRAFRMRCCRLLDLPASVVRAVICDCELDSSHHLQNGSATKRDTTDRPR